MNKLVSLGVCGALVMGAAAAQAKEASPQGTPGNFVLLKWSLLRVSNSPVPAVSTVETYTLTNHQIVRQKFLGFSMPSAGGASTFGGFNGQTGISGAGLSASPVPFGQSFSTADGGLGSGTTEELSPDARPLSDEQWNEMLAQVHAANVPSITGVFAPEKPTAGNGQMLKLILSTGSTAQGSAPDQGFALMSLNNVAPPPYKRLAKYLSKLVARKFTSGASMEADAASLGAQPFGRASTSGVRGGFGSKGGFGGTGSFGGFGF